MGLRPPFHHFLPPPFPPSLELSSLQAPLVFSLFSALSSLSIRVKISTSFSPSLKMDMTFLDSWLNSGSRWFHEEKIPFKKKKKKKKKNPLKKKKKKKKKK